MSQRLQQISLDTKWGPQIWIKLVCMINILPRTVTRIMWIIGTTLIWGTAVTRMTWIGKTLIIQTERGWNQLTILFYNKSRLIKSESSKF